MTTTRMPQEWMPAHKFGHQPSQAGSTTYRPAAAQKKASPRYALHMTTGEEASMQQTEPPSAQANRLANVQPVHQPGAMQTAGGTFFSLSQGATRSTIQQPMRHQPMITSEQPHLQQHKHAVTPLQMYRAQTPPISYSSISQQQTRQLAQSQLNRKHARDAQAMTKAEDPVVKAARTSLGSTRVAIQPPLESQIQVLQPLHQHDATMHEQEWIQCSPADLLRSITPKLSEQFLHQDEIIIQPSPTGEAASQEEQDELMQDENLVPIETTLPFVEAQQAHGMQEESQASYHGEATAQQLISITASAEEQKEQLVQVNFLPAEGEQITVSLDANIGSSLLIAPSLDDFAIPQQKDSSMEGAGLDNTSHVSMESMLPESSVEPEKEVEHRGGAVEIEDGTLTQVESNQFPPSSPHLRTNQRIEEPQLLLMPPTSESHAAVVTDVTSPMLVRVTNTATTAPTLAKDDSTPVKHLVNSGNLPIILNETDESDALMRVAEEQLVEEDKKQNEEECKMNVDEDDYQTPSDILFGPTSPTTKYQERPPEHHHLPGFVTASSLAQVSAPPSGNYLSMAVTSVATPIDNVVTEDPMLHMVASAIAKQISEMGVSITPKHSLRSSAKDIGATDLDMRYTIMRQELHNVKAENAALIGQHAQLTEKIRKSDNFLRTLRNDVRRENVTKEQEVTRCRKHIKELEQKVAVRTSSLANHMQNTYPCCAVADAVLACFHYFFYSRTWKISLKVS